MHKTRKRLVFPLNYCWTCHEYLTKQMFWEFHDVREYQFIKRIFIFHCQREKNRILQVSNIRNSDSRSKFTTRVC